jgi:hypothetical protein
MGSHGNAESIEKKGSNPKKQNISIPCPGQWSAKEAAARIQANTTVSGVARRRREGPLRAILFLVSIFHGAYIGIF